MRKAMLFHACWYLLFSITKLINDMNLTCQTPLHPLITCRLTQQMGFTLMSPEKYGTLLKGQSLLMELHAMNLMDGREVD